MNRHPRAGLAALALGGLALAGCGASTTRSTGAANTSAKPPGPAAATVEVRSTGLGQVLTTSGGQVLYLLTADRPGVRSCAGSCLQYWPPVVLHATPSAASGVTAHLGQIALNGGQQLTVNGQPAYTYIGDSRAGQTAGQGVHSFGGTWWVLSTAGAPITATAPAASSTSVAHSYGGY